jgi:hypothetical protein
MPSCNMRMSACGSTLRAKGSVSGSRIQHRDSCRAALPKPASCRYRQTVCRVRGQSHGASHRIASLRGSRTNVWGRERRRTEIVHHIAAEQRHDIISAGGGDEWVKVCGGDTARLSQVADGLAVVVVDVAGYLGLEE